MLGSIRNVINSKVGAVLAILLLILIAVAFALGDIAGTGSISGGRSATVAKVGGEKLRADSLSNAVQNSYREARRENPLLDIGTYVREGGLESVFDRLLNTFSIAVFGEQKGMAVSQAMIDAEIRDLPGTRGIDGSFDADAYRRLLADANISDQVLREDIRRNLYTEQLMALIETGNAVGESFALPYGNLILEKRAGKIAVIPSTAFISDKNPSEAELAAFYKANSKDFTRPEARAIRYALFDADIAGAAAKVSDADISDYYESNKDAYAASETRAVSQLIIASEAEANNVAEAVRGGMSLADAAKEEGLSVNKTGQLSRAELADRTTPAVAAAVFAATEGQIAKVAKGKLGWHVVKVDSVEKRAGKSLADAKTEISELLGKEKRAEALFEITSSIEEELDSGASLEEIAKSYKLKPTTTPLLNASGEPVNMSGYRPVPEMQRILPIAFDLEPEGESRLVEIERGSRFAVVSIADRKAAAPPPLKEISALVQRQYKLEKGMEEATKAANKVRKQVADGMDLAMAIAALGKPMPQPQKLGGSRLDLIRGQEKVPPPVGLLFSMAEGTVKKLELPRNGGWFIVQLDDIELGDARDNKQLLTGSRQQISQAMREELGRQFVAAMKSDLGVERNDEAIDDLRKRLIGEN